MPKTHEHNWVEISPGYSECRCGASRLLSKQEAKDA